MWKRRAKPAVEPTGAFRLDDERDTSTRSCIECGATYTLVKGFVFRDEVPFAVYFAACHIHEGVREAWLDIVLGTFSEDPSACGDHITFGVRVGPVDGQDEPAATMVAGAIPYNDGPLFGHKLTRDDGLAHPSLPDCWRLVDFVLDDDPVVHAHVYDSPDSRKMLRDMPWPFPSDRFPDALGAVVQRTVLDGTEPARAVTHWIDGSWTVGDGAGDPNAASAASATHIWHVIAQDPSVGDLAMLPPGYEASRTQRGDEWSISPHEPPEG